MRPGGGSRSGAAKQSRTSKPRESRPCFLPFGQEAGRAEKGEAEARRKTQAGTWASASERRQAADGKTARPALPCDNGGREPLRPTKPRNPGREGRAKQKQPFTNNEEQSTETRKRQRQRQDERGKRSDRRKRNEREGKKETAGQKSVGSDRRRENRAKRAAARVEAQNSKLKRPDERGGGGGRTPEGRMASPPKRPASPRGGRRPSGRAASPQAKPA